MFILNSSFFCYSLCSIRLFYWVFSSVILFLFIYFLLLLWKLVLLLLSWWKKKETKIFLVHLSIYSYDFLTANFIPFFFISFQHFGDHRYFIIGERNRFFSCFLKLFWALNSIFKKANNLKLCLFYGSIEIFFAYVAKNRLNKAKTFFFNFKIVIRFGIFIFLIIWK